MIKENKISRLEIIGEDILKRLIVCDSNTGGTFTFISGSQGSGKTAFMLMFMKVFMQIRPQDRIFFASTFHSPLQFLKLDPSEWNIMVQNGTDITFHDRDNHMVEIKPPITYFDSYKQCYNKALPGKCNAVFFKQREQWMVFIHYLRKYVPEWKHVFIDEIADITPCGQSGVRFHMQELFSKDCSEIRKSMMTVMSNSQTIQDIDWRILKKVMIKIFLPGSIPGRSDRVYQEAIDNLPKDIIKGNKCYAQYDGQFGLMNVNEIFHPKKGYNWQANIPEDAYKDMETKILLME